MPKEQIVYSLMNSTRVSTELVASKNILVVYKGDKSKIIRGNSASYIVVTFSTNKITA